MTNPTKPTDAWAIDTTQLRDLILDDPLYGGANFLSTADAQLVVDGIVDGIRRQLAANGLCVVLEEDLKWLSLAALEHNELEQNPNRRERLNAILAAAAEGEMR